MPHFNYWAKGMSESWWAPKKTLDRDDKLSQVKTWSLFNKHVGATLGGVNVNNIVKSAQRDLDNSQ
eukprot:CAMPEP_0114548962 /NCGR_PEP_ID=MMETSP0114-20121206/5267_1 /TAXON_ID=31324 /ORGANISM="Goniomonas sp, Strain m" /LENGTH=65 /DNA_ID=CAMNT_0001733599 /DNA_START=52 /DNA_END=249 /DNA_ORIENTATION=+